MELRTGFNAWLFLIVCLIHFTFRAQAALDVNLVHNQLQDSTQVRHSLTRLYLQDRTVKWALAQSLTDQDPAYLNANQVDALLNFVESYLAQPAVVLRPQTAAEFRSQSDFLLKSPLLLQHEIRRLFIRGDLPPRYEVDLSALGKLDLLEATEKLQTFEFQLKVPLVARAWFGMFSSRAFFASQYSVFDLLTGTNRESENFRNRLRAISDQKKIQITNEIRAGVTTQLQQALAQAEARIGEVKIGDAHLNRFLQVFVITYLRNLPQNSLLQVVSHLLQYGYPIEKLSGPRLVELILERSGPRAVKIVQSVARQGQLPKEWRDVFTRFEQDAPAVPSYYLKDEILALTPTGKSLILEAFPVGKGSVAQVYEGRLDQNKVAARFLKPGIRELAAGELVAIDAGINAVEKDSQLDNTVYSRLRPMVEDLNFMIKQEIDDARVTEEKQKLAHKDYHGQYQMSDGWKVDFTVPATLEHATRDGGLQEWVQGVGFDQFTHQYPNLKIEVQQKLLSHFLRMALLGQVHGDLHPGNIRFAVDPAGKHVHAYLLDAGMYEIISLPVRQGLVRFFLGIQLNQKDLIAQGLEKMQRSDRQPLSRESINAMVDQALKNPEQNTGQRILSLSAEMVAAGYSADLTASAIIRSLTSLQSDPAVQVKGKDFLDRLMKEAFQQPRLLKEYAQVASLSLGDVGLIGSQVTGKVTNMCSKALSRFLPLLPAKSSP